MMMGVMEVPLAAGEFPLGAGAAVEGKAVPGTSCPGDPAGPLPASELGPGLVAGASPVGVVNPPLGIGMICAPAVGVAGGVGG